MPYTSLCRPAILGAFLFHDFLACFRLDAWSKWIVAYYHWYGSIACILMIIIFDVCIRNHLLEVRKFLHYFSLVMRISEAYDMYT